jgi:DHA2 family methylenomycin A resistance protein-like MFS transporter
MRIRGSQKTTPGNPLSALVASTTAFTLVIIGTTVVNVALPAIHDDLGSSTAGLQWVVNAYTLMLASLLLTMGALCDQKGGRRVMLGGVSLFVCGAVLAAAAPDLAFLLAGQLLLGTGAAALLPASLALISNAYSDRRSRGRAVAIYASASAVAIGLGPVLGGLLIDAFSWRAIFAIDVPLALLIGVLVLADVRETPRRPRRSLDPWGQVTVVIALAALTFAVIESGSGGWLQFPTLGPLLLAIVAGTAFIAIERHGSAPMLPLSIFASRAFSVSAVAGLLVNLAVYGQFFIFSLYLQELRGISPLQTGLFLLVQPGVASISALAAGVVANRRGPRLPTIVGGLVAMAGPLLILGVGIGADSSYAPLIIGLALLGAGAGFSVPAMTVAVVAGSRSDQVGIASASFTASRQIGGILGVAVLGALTEQPVSLPGIRVAFAVAAAALCGSALLGLLIPPTVVRADEMTVVEAVVVADA